MIPSATAEILSQRQAALSEVVYLMFVKDNGCLLTRLAHDVEEQVGDSFVDCGLLFAGGAFSTLTGHKYVHDWHMILQEGGGRAQCALPWVV
ncbi:hypothetical protein AWM79_09895 [Pseudomonas agarici]|uniref:Uncharacterized protein n=1 Tax=Pseudomonas agarici TaxID=46677 RepID=A0A0X1T0K8_PSEAA|nr:hypothetical protein AWM79_09895 [Pseudomonas agarici]